MKKFKVFAAALAICALSVTAGGCSDNNKVGKWFDQLLCTHEWDDGEVIKEATCASKGEIKYTCESCEKTKTKKTDKLPHTEVEIELEATCAKEGLTDGVKCAVCEEVLQQPKVVAKIPHFEVPNSEAVAATCTTAGLKPGTHCARCDEVITAETVIPALGHTEVPDSETIEATCTTAGLKPGTHCGLCNEVLSTAETIPMLEHEFEYGYCVQCSSIDSSITQNATEVAAQVGEFVAGNWYRLYRGDSYNDMIYFDGTTIAIFATNTDYSDNYVFCAGPLYRLDGMEVIETDEYIDFHFRAGTYMLSPDMGRSLTIDENTVFKNVSDRLYRLTFPEDHKTVIGKSGAIAPTCTDEGVEASTYCMVCNKVLTVGNKINALGHADNNADDICDRCNEYLFPAAEAGELVVGKTYRV